MSQVLGRVLYDDRSQDTGVTNTYDGTIVAGFELVNAFDWRDFSLFRVQGGVSNVDILLASDADIDTAAIFVGAGTAGTLELQYESAPAVFTTLATFSGVTNTGGVAFQEFTKVTVLAGRKVRWAFDLSGAMDMRQMSTGVQLRAPIGQRDGLSPATLNSGIVVNNQISVNGSVVGRSIRRLDRKNTIEWEYVTETFVRDEWDVFTTHMNRKACFYAWDFDRFPLEVVFGSAEAIPAPVNTTPAPFMKVTLPIRVID